MSENRRTTIYLEPDLHRALRLRAIETDSSISDLVLWRAHHFSAVEGGLSDSECLVAG